MIVRLGVGFLRGQIGALVDEDVHSLHRIYDALALLRVAGVGDGAAGYRWQADVLHADPVNLLPVLQPAEVVEGLDLFISHVIISLRHRR